MKTVMKNCKAKQKGSGKKAANEEGQGGGGGGGANEERYRKEDLEPRSWDFMAGIEPVSLRPGQPREDKTGDIKIVQFLED